MNSNRNLLFIFLGLLAIYIFTRLYNSPKTRSFDKEIVSVDTSSVTAIMVVPRVTGEEIMLSRQEGSWEASRDGRSLPASQNTVRSILTQLTAIEVKRMVSRNPEQWTDYEVTDSLGTRVVVYAGKKVLDDFILGRFSFNQQTRDAISYVRKHQSDDTYAIDGFLSLTFNQGYDSFVDKTILSVRPEDLVAIRYTSDGQTVSIEPENNGTWSVAGATIDSSDMATYFNRIRNLSGSDIYEGDTSLLVRDEQITLVREDQNIDITSFSTPGIDPDYIIHSTENPELYFSSDSAGVYRTIFTNIRDLMRPD